MICRFLVDEDVDVAIVPFLRMRGHDVIEARAQFGVSTSDKTNAAWARNNGAIYLSCDSKYAWPRRKNPQRPAVVLLRNLGTRQLDRVRDLIEVIETEAERRPTMLFVCIERDEYSVLR
jgi:predicted nuclease of predicted toxin-antitoxin system